MGMWNKNLPNIFLIGFNINYIETFDFHSYNLFLIAHSELIDSLPRHVNSLFVKTEKIEIPHIVDMNLYEKAYRQIEERAEDLAKVYSNPDYIVGIYEHTLVPAARLKEKFNIEGLSSKEIEYFRDKGLMKSKYENSDVEVPRFISVNAESIVDEILKVVKSWGTKIVIKPNSQAGASGVKVLNNVIDLRKELLAIPYNCSFQIEEYIDLPIFHFDGVIRNSEMLFFSAAEYYGTCYDFETKKSVCGSISVNDPLIYNSARRFTDSILQKMPINNGVFHLEAFHKGNGEFIFLEIANRFAGAGIPEYISSLFQIDIAFENRLAETNEQSRITSPILAPPKECMAWLYIPIKSNNIVRVRGFIGMDKLPASVVNARFPSIGTTFNKFKIPFTYGASFILSGPDKQTVIDGIDKISNTFEVIYEDLCVTS